MYGLVGQTLMSSHRYWPSGRVLPILQVKKLGPTGIFASSKAMQLINREPGSPPHLQSCGCHRLPAWEQSDRKTLSH